MRYPLLVLILTALTALADRPIFGQPTKFEAARVQITSVQRNGDSLMVEFNGTWTDGPLPILSKAQRNAVIFRPDTADDEQSLKNLEERFQTIRSRLVSLSFESEGWATYCGVPMVAAKNVQIEAL